ncbi:type II secretion system F family protein, partial [Candidatus Parcubacteria bacterium]|nr:type II secretion system F family protein [Candidatus Parcubacteria bacterium]
MPVHLNPESSSDIEENDKQKISLYQKINDMVMSLSRVSLKEKLFFVQHLGLMLKSGISLSIAISTISKQTENKYFLKVLTDVGSQVEKGTAFAESLRPYKKVFGELFIAMIEAGELSGKL